MTSCSWEEAFHTREGLRDREGVGNILLTRGEVHSRGAMAMAHLRGQSQGVVAHLRGAVKRPFLLETLKQIETGEFMII